MVQRDDQTLDYATEKVEAGWHRCHSRGLWLAGLLGPWEIVLKYWSLILRSRAVRLPFSMIYEVAA